ncbi:MAG: TonB-dependent receptor [Flavobacteriales bacterium]
MLRQPYMRSILLCFALALGTVLMAQVDVRVVDAGDGTAIPFAHVAVLSADSVKQAGANADDQGHAVLPKDVLSRGGMLVQASALGYRTLVVPAGAGPLRMALQRANNQLGDLVVTGQYGPTRADQAVHKVRVIDQEQLRKLAANDLSDALRNELNIRLSQDNVLGSSMSMQGLSGENVKILVDGIPVIGRQDGNIDLTQIGLNGIDRIEVVEGPLSVSYGTNALAGTVNLITKRNAGTAPTLRVMTYAEQIGRLDMWASASQRFGRHGFTLNLGRDYFNGWNPGQAGIPSFAATVADSTRFQQWKPREKYSARLNYRWYGEKWQLGYKGEFNNDRITNRGLPRPPYNESAFDEQYLTERFDNAFFADRYWAQGRKLSIIAAHDRYVRRRNTWARDLTTLGEQLVTTEGMQDTSRFTLTNVRAVYASAADSARLRYEFGTDLNYETGAGQRIGKGEQAIGDYAVYTSVEYRPLSRLVLRPAVRYAHNTVYGAPLVPSFNLRYQVKPTLALRASYARGFRAPSLKELYFLFVDVNHNIQGNMDLKAESSNNYGASLTWARTRNERTWRAEISGFFNDINDLITLAQVDGTLYSYVNIGRYRTAGGNLGAGWEDKHWTITVGGNLTGRSDDLAQQQDQTYLWSNEVRGSVGRRWKKAGLSAQVFYKRQGRLGNYIYLSDGSVGRGTIHAYDMADASLTKSLWKDRLRATVGAKNLFDVQNVATSQGSGGVHSQSATSIPVLTGRIWFVRLELGITGKER